MGNNLVLFVNNSREQVDGIGAVGLESLFCSKLRGGTARHGRRGPVAQGGFFRIGLAEPIFRTTRA